VSGRVGALAARVLGNVTVSTFPRARVAAFWAYIRGARAREGSAVTRVVRSVRGVKGFTGC
jgi:hypothetical protein